MNVFRELVNIISSKVESDILKLKKKVAFNKYIILGSSDEVILFRHVLRKDILDNDDINDLLLCYSDHVMSDYELLEFAKNNRYVLYEMEEAVFNADIRSLIIKYLIQSEDKEILTGLLKMYKTELIGIGSDNKTLYDIYLLIEEIVNIKDDALKKDKAIEFMMNYSIRPFLNIFRSLGIDYSDIQEYINKKEKQDKRFLPDNIALLLDNKLVIDDRRLGSEYLVKRVLTEYKKYSSSHITFNLNEFVNYYNSTFNDDFSSFYYNKTSKLDVELLISILTRDDEYEDSLMIYGEFLDKFLSLNDINYEWQQHLSSYFNNKIVQDNIVRTVMVRYANVIERLKQGIDITFEYFVYLNIPDEYRDAFNKVIKWQLSINKNYFGRNIFVNSKEQEDLTFKLILSTYRESIFNDFNNRKAIHKEYLSFIRRMTNTRYISNSEWNEYLYIVTREYYAREGFIHIRAMDKLLSDGKALLPYQIENFGINDFNCMIAALKHTHPDMEDTVIRVKSALNRELFDDVITSRLYVEELIIERHSEIVRNFINSGCPNKITFLKEYGLSSTRFDRAIMIVHDRCPELYDQYRFKVESMINSNTCFIGSSLKNKKN